MAAAGRSEVAPVSFARLAESLRAAPGAWDFFAAVRAVEQILPERSRVGGFVDPGEESVRFEVPPSLAFPLGEVARVELPEDDDDAARMTVNFMGLIGPQGVLPHHYTLLVAERARARDHSLGDFLDIFHHRAISLFYRAWQKNRLDSDDARGNGRMRQHVLDLVGMGLSADRESTVPDGLLVFYAGLLGRQQRSAVALEQLIEDYFQVPVAVEQFVGGLYPLSRRDQCMVGDETRASSRLGAGAVVGDAVWDQQAGVRIRLGPMDRRRYEDFLPTGSAYEPLRALVRFFAHDQYEFEVQLVLDREEVPGCVLGDEPEEGGRLGWSTWVRSRPFHRDADETILKL